ncbi:serine protease, S1-C subfamily, contains C-terminal PDZ domain [Alkalithermobacter thermoalcaliphilus JW-YL-7 = DSM 7308]|uniref:PDZ/DHR/GLGF domain protein n=1 Tax=Alkalithermobacter thermoalcaliphilus JW-YL-7 = DSM 7308 TaxID=1121328 RepID=A0A150FT12_CLOPD|nr:PDZ/DHR/GLGF domain protein [[Clostridium] paradoxum JW-YL-7 = DSM 7308]SHL09898.1 serine protease, S1-C subfamily, contains C-terminal PDZ domain [[Clostridium] paradoxum JW-YL-7 = DSM 7308]
MKSFSTALIGAIIGSMLTLYFAPTFLQSNDNTTHIQQPQQKTVIVNEIKEENIYKAVAKKAMPSVVGITTVTVERDFFFGNRRTSGVGTGVIVHEKGYILTNSHVIGDGNAQVVNVLFYDGSKEEAKVVWYDRTLDLAVIHVNKKDLDVAELGDSDKVEVGDIAIAIGNPLGLEFERSLTQGVISGLHRSIPISQTEVIEDLIQTDASINPGNSGGPLLNSSGQVIGINTAKIQSGEGLGFAIPINTAKPIVDQIIATGSFERVYLGIKGVNVDVFEQATGVDISADEGIYVVEVSRGTPAQIAGIKVGDVIVKVGGKQIKNMSSLIRELYKYRPSDEVDIQINREGTIINVKVRF